MPVLKIYWHSRHSAITLTTSVSYFQFKLEAIKQHVGVSQILTFSKQNSNIQYQNNIICYKISSKMIYLVCFSIKLWMIFLHLDFLGWSPILLYFWVCWCGHWAMLKQLKLFKYLCHFVGWFMLCRGTARSKMWVESRPSSGCATFL